MLSTGSTWLRGKDVPKIKAVADMKEKTESLDVRTRLKQAKGKRMIMIHGALGHIWATICSRASNKPYEDWCSDP
ncbi:MAG: hypothetical protein U5L00_21190 [Desulfovermiculus sp.]|nr:hypothetical protein [Desulfovermiculus sp.]